jgi:hypothetical protein
MEPAPTLSYRQQQDVLLDNIGTHISRVGEQAITMRDELDKQHNTIDDLHVNISHNNEDIIVADSRVKKLIERAKSCKWPVIILFLCVIIFVLLLIIILG